MTISVLVVFLDCSLYWPSADVTEIPKFSRKQKSCQPKEPCANFAFVVFRAGEYLQPDDFDGFKNIAMLNNDTLFILTCFKHCMIDYLNCHVFFFQQTFKSRLISVQKSQKRRLFRC